MQTHEDIKRARRPERPAQVTAKKETVLSPEPVHNFKDHREIIARKHRKANRRREVFLARLAAARYFYSKKRPEPSAEAMQAVRYVFDFGMIASTEPIKYFYNPDLVASKFHESQRYIMTINNHRFYAEKED